MTTRFTTRTMPTLGTKIRKGAQSVTICNVSLLVCNKHSQQNTKTIGGHDKLNIVVQPKTVTSHQQKLNTDPIQEPQNNNNNAQQQKTLAHRR